MNRRFCALLLLPYISACADSGGNVATSTTIRSQSANSSIIPTQALAETSLQSALPYRSEYMYVRNYADQSILIYAHDASGNAPPLGIIKGSRTQLTNDSSNLSQDAAGNLYVANGNSLLVFAHGASGNVAPIRVLSGPQTGITNITAMTVDKKTGKIFVAVDFPSAFGSLILRFPPNATGNTAPFATSSVYSYTWGFTSDSTGNNLIGLSVEGPTLTPPSVVTFDKQFANGTRPQTSNRIFSLYTGRIADDPNNKTYVVTTSSNGGMYTGGSAIMRFAESASGHGPIVNEHQNIPASYTPNIVSEINDNCAGGIAVQAPPYPNTYVTHSSGAQGCTDAVYVYPESANGSAKPLRILQGPATMLNQAADIYEGK